MEIVNRLNQMASSSVSQEDHDVEHEFALASRRAKVRSARANRSVNTYPSRGEDLERDVEGESNIPKYEQTSVVLVEQNDASPKPICRAIIKDKRSVTRGAHSGKSNKGVRDRRKLREKRRSTGVMHLPSTESTGGSTGEDENNENSIPPSIPKVTSIVGEPEEKVMTSKQGKSESDLDADDEANNSGDVRISRGDRDENGVLSHIKAENERLIVVLQSKEKRIAALEIQKLFVKSSMPTEKELEDFYRPYVTKLHNQWLARESWCDVKGPDFQHQRRHYPNRQISTIRFRPPLKNQPFGCCDGHRGVIFPTCRRLFPSLRNNSFLDNFM
ncbi:unnamed protein product [Allacma fusca]|uniref:Uncharacterized protein n=1 Tax=Allacma fusca TaxID=39272 RepID=A0A8J2P2V0_9HEXA|nr:unnamed protein product [Allacma fusca]